jgi:hypothetical protein
MDIDHRTSDRLAGTLVGAIVFTLLGGLGVITGLLVVMKRVLSNDGLVDFFALLSFLLLILTESVFVWLLLRRKALPRRTAAELTEEAASVQMLPESPASVVENTTRNFEIAAREPEHSGSL